MKIAAVLSLLLSSSAFAAVTYTCDDGSANNLATVIEIDDTGKVQLPRETGKLFAGIQEVGETEVACVPKGQGRLFWNGTGPGSWTYRVPAEAFQAAPTIQVGLITDGDNDGICGDDEVLNCKK